MELKKRVELIKRNTQEIVSETELVKLLKKKKKPSAYIGYATTGMLHIGHLIPIVKLADLIKAEISMTFMAADIHAYLDNQKSPWDLLDARAQIYLEIIQTVLSQLGVNKKKVKLIKGSEFEFSKDYWLDVLKMSNLVTLNRTKRATSEVVRFGETPRLGGFFYPLMQIEDVVALKSDIAFSGIDQRGIYMLGRELLPQINHKKPICIFTPLLSNLEGSRMGGKMSATSGNKISLLDSQKEISEKIKKAFCPVGEIKNNPVLDLFELVIFPILEYQKKKLIIKRPKKFGGDLKIKDFKDLIGKYKAGLHPADLKNTLASELNKIISKIRQELLKKLRNYY